MPNASPRRRSPALLATAAALPIALLAGLLTFWFLRDRGSDDPATGDATGAVTVSPPPADQATEVACRALLANVPNQLVGPARPGRKVVYSGDTRPVATLVEAARGADLLVHEATFIDEEKDRAVETGHSTAREAGRVAREAGVRQLVLTHISPRYTRDAPELLAEAKEEFPEVVVARDGLELEVKYRDEEL